MNDLYESVLKKLNFTKGKYILCYKKLNRIFFYNFFTKISSHKNPERETNA